MKGETEKMFIKTEGGDYIKISDVVAFRIAIPEEQKKIMIMCMFSSGEEMSLASFTKEEEAQKFLDEFLSRMNEITNDSDLIGRMIKVREMKNDKIRR